MNSEKLASVLGDTEKFQFFSQEAEKVEKFGDDVQVCETASENFETILQDYGNIMEPQQLEAIRTKKGIPAIDESEDSDSASLEFDAERGKDPKDTFSFLTPQDIPYVGWDDIIGLKNPKLELKKALMIPFDFPGTVQAKKAAKAICLYGSEGVGKAYLVRAAVSNTLYKFFNLEVDAVLSDQQGESPKRIGQLFKEARRHAPSIIFIDECDLLCGTRKPDDGEAMRSIKTKLLTEMNGLLTTSDRVIVIGSTATPWELDHAFLWRFTKRVYADLPNEEERVKLLDKFLNQYGHSLTPNEVLKVAKFCERFSGSDLEKLVITAGNVQLDFLGGDSRIKQKIDLRVINRDDMKTAIESVGSTCDPDYIKKLEKWNEEFGNKPRNSFQIDLEEREPKREPIILSILMAIGRCFTSCLC